MKTKAATLVGEEKLARTLETIRKISRAELMRFKVGLDGLPHRPLGNGDCAVGILGEDERESLLSPTGFHRHQLETARGMGAKTGLIYFGAAESLKEIREAWADLSLVGRDSVEPISSQTFDKVRAREILAPPDAVLVSVPQTDFLLDGVTRVGVKMLLNALSTCTMVRLGRVMGNFMIWVVPSNLKLIDRATRYIEKLAGLNYESANRLLFEVIEYVEPRMKADQAYPPVVGMAVLRAKNDYSNAEAERKLSAALLR